MTRPPRFRTALAILALAALLIGCQTAMSAPSDMQTPPPETHAVPLRFARHNFEAFCYNTLSCSVVYTNHEFKRLAIDKPSGAPPSTDYKSHWPYMLYAGIRNFPPPAEVRWISLDGVKHEARIDMAKIFEDQLVWHKVPKSDMRDFYRGPVAGEPNIYLEVNDRTINVYMTMLVPTRKEQIPGDKMSFARDDLFLAWTHTY